MALSHRKTGNGAGEAYRTHTQRKDSTQKMMDKRFAVLLQHGNELGKSRLLENETRQKRNKRAQWTPQKRAAQSRKARQTQFWRHSTGPKTKVGKAKSKYNAYKHGFEGYHYIELRKAMAAQQRFVTMVMKTVRQRRRNARSIRAMQAQMKKTMTIQAMVAQVRGVFDAAPLDIPPHEAKLLVREVAGGSAEALITAPDTLLTAQQLGDIESAVTRRVDGEPLYRILGRREFWGLEFEVTPDTLDPRPDTETLVESVIKSVKTVIASNAKQSNLSAHPSESWDLIPKKTRSQLSLGCEEWLGSEGGCDDLKDWKMLDLGTGTGCIPISLLTELPHAQAMATDISEAALEVARRNALTHNVKERFETRQSDWFSALAGQRFDIITSNPPYISDEVIQKLAPEVKNHDPILALSGGQDGLDAYKIIISGLHQHLNSQGRAFLEIGYDQLADITRLVDDSALRLCAVHHDLGGHPRIIELGVSGYGDK